MNGLRLRRLLGCWQAPLEAGKRGVSDRDRSAKAEPIPLWIGLLSSLLWISPVQAMGFTGVFDPKSLDPLYWTPELRYGAETDPKVESVDLYDCAIGEYACIQIDDQDAGNATLQVLANGNQRKATILTWEWKNTQSVAYVVSFSWAFVLDGDVQAQLTVGNFTTVADGSNLSGSVSGQEVQPKASILFKITAPFNDQSSGGDFSITGFDGSVVPAPLPAAGAAAAFACSRRLRRLRSSLSGERPGERPVARPAAAPSAYLATALHLPVSSLAQVPLSFDYPES